jgi:hypothetical protein
MLAAFEDLAGIGALPFEHAAGVMQSMGEHVELGVGPRHDLAIVPNDPVALVKGQSHGVLSSTV